MISKESIQSMTDTGTYVRGRNLYKEDDFQVFEVFEDGPYDEIYANVKGSGGKRYIVNVTVDLRLDEIVDFQCECAAYKSYAGLCKHCVAAALKYQNEHTQQKTLADYGFPIQEVEKKSQGKKKQVRHTTPELKELLKQKEIQKNLLYLQGENWGKVHLEPIMTLYTDGIQLEFKIGMTQMYVVKDIFALVQRIQGRENYKYGKKLEFVHAEEMFDAQSRSYVEFLKKWTRENRERYMSYSSYYGYYGYMEPKSRELNLDGSDLDGFLDNLGEEGILCGFVGKNKEYYYLKEEALERKLRISGSEDGITVELQGILGYRTRNFYVCFEKGGIYRVAREKYEPVEEFLECLEYVQKGKVFVEKADIPAFCSGLLPELKKAFRCECKNFDEQLYAPMQAECKVYLDKKDGDLITLKAVACYSNKEYSVYDDKTDMPQRDLMSEMKVRNVVNQYSNAYDNIHKMMVLSHDEELLYELLTEGIARLQEVAEVFVSDALKRVNVVNAPSVTVGVSLSGDLLELQLTTDEMSREELIEMLSKYNRKRKYYRLKSGDFVQVQDSGVENLLELRDGLQLTEKQLKQEVVQLPRYRALFMDAQLKNSRDLKTVRDINFRNLIKNMKTIEDNDFKIPEELEAVLREYQKTGFLWIKTLKYNGFGGILADDMGLGKTLQVISFLLSEYADGIEEEKRHTLIVTPASLIYNWKNEFETFAPILPVRVVAGTAKEREKIIKEISKHDILITSYDLLKRDLEHYQDLNFHYQVIDEAQFIKNQGTQVAKAVKEIKASFRLALTGTPIENRLSELWSIFDYLMPGFLFSAQRFREEFENKIIKEQDEKALNRIQKMTAPFILRRLKKDVLKDLPEKTEESRLIPLEGEQQKLYDAHVKRLQMILQDKSEEDFRGSKLQILAELTKIRQICCDPGLIFEGYKGEAVKLDLCVRMIQNAVANGHKILLFSQFTTMLERIQERLQKEKITFYTLTGAVNKEKRRLLVDAFQTDDTSVFCISLKAGGTGLNLTAADIVIHYDPWWNVAAQNQATDRAHRIGQKNMVNVYKLITKGTIEEKIVKLQEKKQELADQILTGEAVGTASFSKEELLSLLQG